jgi:hypothetical protein
MAPAGWHSFARANNIRKRQELESHFVQRQTDVREGFAPPAIPTFSGWLTKNSVRWWRADLFILNLSRKNRIPLKKVKYNTRFPPNAISIDKVD